MEGEPTSGSGSLGRRCGADGAGDRDLHPPPRRRVAAPRHDTGDELIGDQVRLESGTALRRWGSRPPSSAGQRLAHARCPFLRSGWPEMEAESAKARSLPAKECVPQGMAFDSSGFRCIC